MIEQYVLLASRYKDVSYADIKQYVYNSQLQLYPERKYKKTTIKGFRQSFYHFWGQFPFKIDQMNIKLIAIGKTDNKALQSLIDDYTKRLSFTSNSNSILYPTLRT
jgi:hypothetical protein